MPTTCFLGKAWRLSFSTALLPCPWHPAPLRTFGSKRRVCSTQGSLPFTESASLLWILLTQRACHSERWFPGAPGSYSSFDSVMAKTVEWVLLSCTWSLKHSWWGYRDQLCSGPDCAPWPVNSPRSMGSMTSILEECTSAFSRLYLQWHSHPQHCLVPTSQSHWRFWLQIRGTLAVTLLGLAVEWMAHAVSLWVLDLQDQ